jgi:alpha,alpha-trehalase
MKLSHLLLLAAAAITSSIAQAQEASAGAGAQPDPAATLRYIHGAWDTLTRSTTDCHSLVDIKVTANPVLYVPAELSVPADAAQAAQKCSVKIVKLPRPIEKIADVRPEELSAPGLLYLPRPYVVPGGRFNEMYGWDSYFIVLGLEADHREALAKDMVDNFMFEIEHYGAVLNANRTYYLTRSQPPFFTSMVRAVYENPASFPATSAGREEAHAWLEHAYTLAEKDYSTWTRPEHLAGSTTLARYYDYGVGPVPEMADDSTYYPDVIRWMVAHPKETGPGYLVKGSEEPGGAEAERLAQTSCDVRTSRVCERAWAGGYRLSSEFYKSDRAMRESGFDPAFRWGPFDESTIHFAPVCLNSLLYRYERDLEHFAHLLGRPEDAMKWDRRAKARDAAIQRYLWDAKEGVFEDYDFYHARKSTYAYISSLYPLWAGVATREEAQQMVAKLNLFERPGGLSMSNFNSGLQWDEPFGWAPTNWIAIDGLEITGFRDDAKRIARDFDATIDNGFATDGTILEKYNVVSRSTNVQVSTGYKANQIGFGWTNSIYLKLKQILGEPITSAGN